MYTIKNLGNTNVDELANAFNQAFADYLIPFSLSAEQLSNKIAIEKIEPSFSAGVFVQNKLIAFIFIGIDFLNEKKVAYNAGTGVIPSYRGNKLTNKMYDYLIPLLENEGINYHLLEVITENKIAHAVYEKVGFRIVRELICFKGYSHASRYNESISFSEINYSSISTIGCFNRFPTYQNSGNAIIRSGDNNITLAAMTKDRYAGFISFNKKTGRVQQFGVEKNYRLQGIGSALFCEAQRYLEEIQLSVINIDKSDTGTISFVRKIGFEITVEQYEMELSV